LGNATLRKQYLGLSNFVRHMSDTIAKVLESSPPNVMFTRDLVGTRLLHHGKCFAIQRLVVAQLT
jgi:hypothetical protein